jgi:hypothetical protein
VLDGRCLIERTKGKVVAWYEVGEKEVEVERANKRLERYGAEVHEK